MAPREARQDLFVVGIGTPLRGDDRVGIELVRRLREHFGPGLACLELYEPEIALAERIANFEELLVVDAMAKASPAAFELVPLSPGDRVVPSGGLTSHVFDWGAILALSHRLYGGHTRGSVLGVAAASFEFSEGLSAACAAHADEAFRFLLDYCSPGA